MALSFMHFDFYTPRQLVNVL